MHLPLTSQPPSRIQPPSQGRPGQPEPARSAGSR
jgi:hypothetical protein